MEPVRHKVIEKFEGLIDPVRAAALELCLYNWCVRKSREDDTARYWQNPKFRYRYTTKAQSLLFNLKNPKNPGLKQRLLSGDMSLKKFVNATPSELFPEMWGPIYERVAAKQLRKQLTVDVENVPDGAFQCKKCKSKKTVFYEMQTRSADEPMTVFIACVNCDNRWKQ